MPRSNRYLAGRLQPLAAAMALAAAAFAALPGPAVAQAPAVAGYSIPPGPLAEALNRFAQQSGAALVIDTAKVRGLQSPGLQGRYGVEDGFAALLRGTGLALGKTDAGYVLVAAPQGARAPAAAGAGAAATTTLREVTVTAQPERDATTEGTGSYTTGSMNTATKLPLSIRETPQSVTVITRERMDDQGLATASDVLKQTPGIAISASAPNRETFHARGFSIENVTIDGLTASGQWTRFGALINDMAIYDRVEVVRGATGLTQGAGTPSAAINFVRKRPTRDFQGYIQGQAGSWNHYNVEADVSNSLNESGSLRGRAVVSLTDADSFMDVVDKKNQIIYLVGEADLAPNTLLTVGTSYQKNNTHNTYAGIPTAPDGSDLHLPRSSYYGTHWNFWNDDHTSAFASLEHRFDNQWKVKLAGNMIWNDNELTMAGISYNSSTGQHDYGSGLQQSTYKRAAWDLNASGPFHWLGRKHEAVFGAEMRVSDADNVTAGYWPSPFYYRNIDIYNFDRGAIVADPYSWAKDYFYASKEKQSGIYGALRLNPSDGLKVIGGLRYSRYRFKDHADWYYQGDQYQGGADVEYSTWGANYSDSHLVKYAGIVVDVDKHHSLYASYTDIFKVQSERDAGNRQLKPIEGVNYEVGAKGEYLDGALNVAAALFRVDQKNLAMADGPCPLRPNETCYRAAGLVRSEGFDLEINGAITRNWSVGGGYSYVAKRVRKDADPSVIGVQQDTHLPTRQFKLTTSYRFLGGKARVGGGVRWQNRVWHYDNWEGHDYYTQQKAYAVVDLMVGYQLSKNIDVQLNVSNLFDKRYYSSINPQPMEWGANSVYGEPRKFLVTAKYRF